MKKSSVSLQEEEELTINTLECALGNSLAWLKESLYPDIESFRKHNEKIRNSLKYLTHYIYSKNPDLINSFVKFAKED